MAAKDKTAKADKAEKTEKKAKTKAPKAEAAVKAVKAKQAKAEVTTETANAPAVEKPNRSRLNARDVAIDMLRKAGEKGIKKGALGQRLNRLAKSAERAEMIKSMIRKGELLIVNLGGKGSGQRGRPCELFKAGPALAAA